MNEMPRNVANQPWTGRVEDDALVRGLGHFTDDVIPQGAVHGYFLRSPHAHAAIRAIDIADAKAMPGVLTIITAPDLEAAGFGSVTHAHPMTGRDGKPIADPHRDALAGKRVRHVGEPVALVVAQTLHQAQAAAEAIAVDYETLPAVTDGRAAVAPGAPQLWEASPGNVALDWAAPPDPEGKVAAAIERAFQSAAHVTRIELHNQRLMVASLEPRSATASYDKETDLFTLRTGTQGVAGIRMQVSGAMKIPPEKLRVVNEDVGGGFGMKASGYPEYGVLLYAARQLGKPVHWTSTRSEAFQSDNQGRDSTWTAELALDAKGKFLALRVEGIGNVGAYLTGVAAFCSTLHVSGCLPTIYDIPLASVRSRCVFSNTVPIGPYRGAGRPEASYLMERVIDKAARETGVDPAQLRKRNLVSRRAIPYKTPFGNTYDSGDFPTMFERALELADYRNVKARKRASKKAGKLRGVGIGCYLEIAGAVPEEGAAIMFPGNQQVHISVGGTAQGQAHRTVFGRLAADRLGVPFESITLLHGDSARDVPGFGVVASRSAMMIGGAISETIDAMLEKGRKVAAMLLQAEDSDIDYTDGAFRVGSSGRQISLFEVAERAAELARQHVIEENLNTKAAVKTGPSFPNGCHIAEVEIDPDTGAVEVASYVAVGDSGNVLNPTIVEAQVHGGVAQGLGQALSEAAVYDSSSGQLLSGSLMDYGMPRADMFPDMVVAHQGTPCLTNPLQVKGTGEAGTTAATPALINAIINALPDTTADIEMPATAERVWRSLNRG